MTLFTSPCWIPSLATVSSEFDPETAALQAVDSLGAGALAKAAAYTTGSEWLGVLGLLVTFGVSWLVLRSRVLNRLWEHLAGRPLFLRTLALCSCFLVLSALLTLPWTLYTDWWRETHYGRTSQPLSDFLMQGGIGLLLSTLLGGLLLTGVYAFLRKTGPRWWLWSGALSTLLTVFLLLVSPILIEPLFNQYKPLPAGPVRAALEGLATEAGIPTDRIFVFDGSRQSNNFTANVSGVGPYARIAISDVALTSASLDEVKAVTGHEIGHYVLHHVWFMTGVLSLLIFAGFYATHRLYPRFARLLGSAEPLASPAGLPVLFFLFDVMSFALQPAVNTLVRANETAADQYSLRTVNLPNALVGALLKTAEYRNPRPHPVEEFCFYTHPSVERRVLAAMKWKAAHATAQGH